MKDKNKTIALLLLALLLYLLFVFAGLNAEPNVDTFNNAFSDYFSKALPQTPNDSYLMSTMSRYMIGSGLVVYNEDEYYKTFGDRLLDSKPTVSMLNYGENDGIGMIIWYDGNHGYVAADFAGLLTGDNSVDVASIFKKACLTYDFDIYIAVKNDKGYGYAPNKNTLKSYIKKSKAQVSTICNSLDQFLTHI